MTSRAIARVFKSRAVWWKQSA